MKRIKNYKHVRCQKKSRNMLLSNFIVLGCPYSKTGFHFTYFKKNVTHRKDYMTTIF
jgi:hypothetical protein